MRATLYALPPSHPVRTARLMLELKGIEVHQVDLLPVVSRVVLRGLGFPGATVPAVKLDGRRIQTTTRLSRELDALVPDPPLFPRDPAARRAVEEAERWGDEVLQSAVRRLAYVALIRDGSGIESMFERPLLGMSPKLIGAIGGPFVRVNARIGGADEESTRRDLAALPGHLDHVDELIATGVIGGDAVNAADLQIAPSTRLLMNFADFRPEIEKRPAGAHAMRLLPRYAGEIPSVFSRSVRGQA